MSSSASFERTYPNVAWWTKNRGRIEIGPDEFSSSLLRVLDPGGMVFEVEDTSKSVDKALAEAEDFIEEWRVKHSL